MTVGEGILNYDPFYHEELQNSGKLFYGKHIFDGSKIQLDTAVNQVCGFIYPIT